MSSDSAVGPVARRSGERRGRRTAVHDRVPAVGAEHGRESGRGHLRVQARQPPEARRRREPAGQDGREARFVHLQHDLGPGDEAADGGDVQAYALGERLDEVTAGALVDDDALAAREPHVRGEGPRPDDLELERAHMAVEGLGELVEVLAQQGPGA